MSGSLPLGSTNTAISRNTIPVRTNWATSESIRCKLALAKIEVSAANVADNTAQNSHESFGIDCDLLCRRWTCTYARPSINSAALHVSVSDQALQPRDRGRPEAADRAELVQGGAEFGIRRFDI